MKLQIYNRNNSILDNNVNVPQYKKINYVRKKYFEMMDCCQMYDRILMLWKLCPIMYFRIWQFHNIEINITYDRVKYVYIQMYMTKQ